MRDSSLMVTVPAKSLEAALSLAQGYSIHRGQFISRFFIEELKDELDTQGYYNYDEDTLF